MEGMNGDEQINNYVSKYFEELFTTKGGGEEGERKWDKFYSRKEENIRRNNTMKDIEEEELHKIIKKQKIGKAGKKEK